MTQTLISQGYQFLYGYTQRNQLDNIKLDPAIFGGYYNSPVVRYTYDASGNHTRRTVLSGAHAEYDIDELNRVRGQSDYFASGQMGRFDYAFDAMGRHRYEQRDWGTADGYQFDPRDQLTGYQRDGDLNMDGTVSAAFWNNTGIQYDANGNRIQVTGNGAATYSVNSLNQYGNVSNLGDLGYDPKGNLTSAAGWTYGYDAQNRLTRMETGGTEIVQTYDPLNRVVTRYVNGVLTQNVWEGWNLIEEHRPDWSIQRCYLQGAHQNEMVAAFDGGVYTNEWFWQDGRGNTSHITGDNAALLERYTYDLSGAPTFYDEWGNERWGGSVYDTRFLFAGSQYLPETGLYDMRNRFYSPALNRFLQTDPIGFAGDALNLYRYCGDDPIDRSDPMGLDDNYANFEDAVPQARAMIKASFSDTRTVSVTIKDSSSLAGRTKTYVPSKMVAILRSPSGHGYEVSKPLEGKLEITGYSGGRAQYHELEGSGLSKGELGRLAGAIHGHNDLTGIARPGNSYYDDNLYKRMAVMERMDQSDQSVWHRREPANNSKGYQDRDIPDTGTPGSSRSSSSNNSSGPSAADVDNAHQATGVPSLGAESVNYVNGRL